MDKQLHTVSREEWTRLAKDANTPLLTEKTRQVLREELPNVSSQEVETVYLALAERIHERVVAVRQLRGGDADLKNAAPFIVGIAGSVSVGKSATARILQILLRLWPEHPHVELVTTDGFLFPNAVLEARGLMQRKGFPESYDRERLAAFLADVKAGREAVAPVYSHLRYDIVPDAAQVIPRPDILILEGVIALQPLPGPHPNPLDFALYVDAEESAIRHWFMERFRRLREARLSSSEAYFAALAAMPQAEAEQIALNAWNDINLVNLREHIAPTRRNADLVLEKDADHVIRNVLC